MKRRRDSEQSLADDKKEKPRNHNASRALGEAENFYKRGTARERWPNQFLQTGGANHPIVMFGDAFTAEKAAAFRAARDGLAQGVIEAALVEKILHAGQFR